MAAYFIALLFFVAVATAIWSIWMTVYPRLPYIRALLTGSAVPALAPAAALRVRTPRPAAISTLNARPLRAVA